MSGAGFKVTGADALTRTLAAAAASLEDLRAASDRAGDIVRGAARAPVRTGNLAGSLVTDAGPAGVRVASRVPYAGVIHWGWPARNIRANPFLSDAATSSETRWLEVYADAVREAVGEVRGA